MEVVRQQEKVNSLHSMVVVVDESNAESGEIMVRGEIEYLRIEVSNSQTPHVCGIIQAAILDACRIDRVES
jgi:hypothetical protein